jgi:hypothetical protein
MFVQALATGTSSSDCPPLLALGPGGEPSLRNLAADPLSLSHDQRLHGECMTPKARSPDGAALKGRSGGRRTPTGGRGDTESVRGSREHVFLHVRPYVVGLNLACCMKRS